MIPAERKPSIFFEWTGLFAAGLLVMLGIFWAFTRPANDFSVFYEAWRLVLTGRGAEIYHATPDRFLYAPGFAWIFCALGLLPRGVALGIWCLAKAWIVGWLLCAFSSAVFAGRSPRARAGLAGWAVVLLARPLLIDFQYGQVNLLILGACAWAMFRHCRRGDEGSWLDGACWAFLAVAAVGKLFPLPLLLIPFFGGFFGPRAGPGGRRRWERAGVIGAVAVTFLAPVLTQGGSGTWALMENWRVALLDRGLPLESHNQSFTAFLYHYFSGLPTEIIAQHRKQLWLGYPFFSVSTITLLSVAWMLIWMGVILALVFRGPRGDRLEWAATLIAILILPSHLIWKPYFVMGLPLGIVALSRFRERWFWFVVIFGVVNLTGFDFLGADLGAELEAACFLLWCHLLLLAVLHGDRAIKAA